MKNESVRKDVTPKFRAVIFDWDGTLVDSCEPSFRCYVKMFAAFGVDFTREMYESTYSPNWYHTFREVGLPEHCWPDADRLWLEHFATEPPPALIDGAKEALDTLAARNVVAGIVTSGTRSRVERELTAFGFDRYVSHVVCGDDGHERKPHPAALRECLNRIGVEPDDAAYVGDSAEDIQMGRAAGVFCVGVLGTYPTHDTLAAAQPDVIATSIEEAIDHLFPDSRRS